MQQKSAAASAIAGISGLNHSKILNRPKIMNLSDSNGVERLPRPTLSSKCLATLSSKCLAQPEKAIPLWRGGQY
jgi:hypothetical protein